MDGTLVVVHLGWALAAWSLAVLGLAVRLGYGIEHGVTEALLPLGLAIAATWSWPDRWQCVGLATAGLFVAHATTRHLVEGHPAAHGSFLALVALVAGYRQAIARWYLLIGIALVHGVLGLHDAHSIYGHAWPLKPRLSLVALEVALVVIASWWLRPRRERKT